MAEDEDIQARIKSLDSSIAANKMHLNSDETTCRRTREYFEVNPSSFNRKELEDAHLLYKNRCKIIDQKYLEIMELAGEGTPKYKAAGGKAITFRTEAEDQLERTARALDRAPAAAAPLNQAPAGGGAQGVGAPRVRVNEALRPKILTRDNQPEELRSWIEKYKSYYSTSAMQLLPIADQHAYIYSVIDLNLETAIRGKMDAATPVFGVDDDDVSCISLLRGEFLLDYPLMIRRNEFFSLRQLPGQKFSAFMAELRRKGREADLNQLTVDQLMVFRLVSGTTDQKLKEKLLKMEDPTLQDVERESRAQEAAMSAMNAMKKQQPQQQHAQANQAQAPGKSKNSWQKSGQACFACGIKGHLKADCEKKASLHCNFCKKHGHAEKACRSKKNKEEKDKNGGAQGGGTRHQSRAASRATSRHPSRSPSRSPARSSYQRGRRSPRPSRSPSPGGRRTYAQVVASTRSASCSSSKPTPRLTVTFTHASGKSFEFRATPDTGAWRTIISEDVAKRYGIPIEEDKMKLIAANDTVMKVVGGVSLDAKCWAGKGVVKCLVTTDMTDDVLMSWHDLINMGILPPSFPGPHAAARSVSASAKLPSYNTKTKTTSSSCKKRKTADSLDAIKKDYADVLSNELDSKSMAGPPMHLYLRDDIDVKPSKVFTARQVPLHWKEDAEKIVNELLKNGIIERVEHPTEWISPGFFVPKDGGKGGLRLVTDFSKLNAFVKRPVHPFPSTRDILQSVRPDSRYFAKLDAVQGYFQIPLDRESADLTTFLLPMGRFRYLVAPMGMNASNDEYCFRTDPAVEGFEWAAKIVDDTLIQARTEAELLERIRLVLDRCRQLGITISLKKLSIGQEIKFAGHVISSEGVKPDGDKVKALSDFPAPLNITDLRSFIGLANQLGSFVPDLTHMMLRMRQLLKKGTAYQWLAEHQEEFEQVKKLLSSELLVKPFDVNLPTELLTDASRIYGLGYMLLQREEGGKPRIIKCGSCALTDCQRRYATIELECLAMQWAVSKCDHYLRGIKKFTIITDHKPLVGVYSKPLHEVDNTRLQRFREKMIPYTFDVSWNAGKDHQIADALSRAPIFQAEEDITQCVTHRVTCSITHDPSMDGLLEAAAVCDDYQHLVKAVKGDVCVKDLSVSHPAKEYQSIWDSLSLFEDGKGNHLVMLDCRQIVVPRQARQKVLELLHLPHAGQVKTKEAAKQLYFWPGMNSAIKNMVDTCVQCSELRSSFPKLPIQEKSEATAPMTHVGVDLFDFQGQDWLVMVDRYSGYPFTQRLRRTTTSDVTSVLNEWFMDWGYPSIIRSDGGPQFRSEFKKFCKDNAIEHELSSPYNPRSNGLAESAVKNVKYLLKKCSSDGSNFKKALLEWRNVPRADGISPSQLFLNRRQKTQLPMPRARMASDLEGQNMREVRKNSLQQNRVAHDKRAVPRAGFQVGTHVRLQDPHTRKWDIVGQIEDISVSGSYYVDIGKKTVRRNASYLRGIEATTDRPTNMREKPVLSPADIPAGIPSPPILRRSNRLKAKAKSVSFSL